MNLKEKNIKNKINSFLCQLYFEKCLKFKIVLFIINMVYNKFGIFCHILLDCVVYPIVDYNC